MSKLASGKMNSAAEERIIENWNKMSVSQKKEYWALKSNEEQKALTNFAKNEKKTTLQLSQSNGEKLELKKVDLPLLSSNKDFTHVVCERGGEKNLYLLHKATGVISPFAVIQLGKTIPDHVVALTPKEMEERLMITHPYVDLHALTTRAMVNRTEFVELCKKHGDAAPIMHNYWRESLCEDFLVATKSVIHNYKNAITQCNALSLMFNQMTSFFNITMKDLFEIDVNTLTCLGTWSNIPCLKPILFDEEPKMTFNIKPRNPPLILAQLLCRFVALKYDTQYCPEVVVALAESERFARIGSNALRAEPMVEAINTAQRLAAATIIDTGDYLKGDLYSFKLCKVKTSDNLDCFFLMLELNEFGHVIDTVRNQISPIIFQQVFEGFRAHFINMFNLNVCNVMGLKHGLHIIHLNHVINIVTFVGQNSRSPRPVILETLENGTDQEKEMDRLLQSYKTHEPIAISFKRMLPDGHYEPEEQARQFHTPVPQVLKIDFIKINDEESESGIDELD